ncbi:MAG: hypothetical protein LBH80_05875 [Prevotellaceae bacterium]|jgi:hypothetical protein|nr:hypothetical protein [Prevotellaceae bacterium]
MKKVIFIVASLFFIISPCIGQGLNNNYQFDNEDLKNIFELQGIHIFKFPFELKQGEYISLSYCIYENGIETDRCDLIEDFQLETDIQINHHLSRRDTTIFHRIYFMSQGDSILNIRVVEPGICADKKMNIPKALEGGFTASLNIEDKLPYKKDILSFYAVYQDSEKYKKAGGFLNCATGSSPERLIADYDFVLIFFAEKITKERAKSILEEDYYRLKHVTKENADR